MSSSDIGFDPEEIVHAEEEDPEEYAAAPPPLGMESDPVDHAEQVAEIELDEPEI